MAMVTSLAANKPRRSLWKAIEGYVFIFPSFVGVLVFVAFPVLFALFMSTQNWDGVSQPFFIGLKNYQDLLSDSIFWISLRNTLIYTLITMPIGVVLSLGIAILLNRKVRGLTFFRTAMFIPVVTSALAISVIWKWIYDFDNGLLNDLLQAIHLSAVPWLSEPAWALIALSIIGIWQGFGFTTIIILAALQNIPESLLDAASIDGARGWNRFRHITLPLISPTLLFVTVISFLGSFQVFTQVYYITDGGPDYGTSVLNFLVFRRAFRENLFGSAAALSYVMFAIIFAVTMIQLRISRNAISAAAEVDV